MKPLRAFLQRHGKIALDTSVFIYQLEANPRYVDLTDATFAWIEQPNHAGIASTITMTELLVPAYRESDESRVDTLYGLLSRYEHIAWIPPDLEIADVAARIRATYRMTTPYAIHAATAIRAKATGLVTNDPIFSRVPGFETLVIERLL
ncbi:MAG TPA: PIN domain-containing protein [Bryobacteraceae bacterium]|nr:PIN domain-containing protein [Bryobacteraceae bacterium]